MIAWWNILYFSLEFYNTIKRIIFSIRKKFNSGINFLNRFLKLFIFKSFSSRYTFCPNFSSFFRPVVDRLRSATFPLSKFVSLLRTWTALLQPFHDSKSALCVVFSASPWDWFALYLPIFLDVCNIRPSLTNGPRRLGPHGQNGGEQML